MILVTALYQAHLVVSFNFKTCFVEMSLWIEHRSWSRPVSGGAYLGGERLPCKHLHGNLGHGPQVKL